MARTRSFVALAFALLGVAYAAASYDIHADHSSAKGFVEWAAARLVQELGALHESRGGDALGTWQDTNIEYCKLPPHLRLCHGCGQSVTWCVVNRVQAPTARTLTSCLCMWPI